MPLQDIRPISLNVRYEHAKQLLLRGYLEQCQLEADRGYQRAVTKNPEWASKFLLLESETMMRRGMFDDALRILAGYDSASKASDGLIRKLTIESIASMRQQDLLSAEKRLTHAEDLCRNEYYPSCGEVWRTRGILAGKQEDFTQARQSFLRAMAFARDHHDRFLEASAILNLGWTALQIDHFDEAIDWTTAAHRMCLEIGAEDQAETSSGNLGWAYFKLGDSEKASQLFIEAEKSAESRGNIRSELGWLATLGSVYQRSGNLKEASQALDRALVLAKQINSKEDIVNSLEDLANLSIEAGELAEASQYTDQLSSFIEGSGSRLDALVAMFAQARIAAARRQSQLAESMLRTIDRDSSSQTSLRMGVEHELAKLHESKGNLGLADHSYRTALTTFETARAQVKNEDSKLPFLANAARIYDDYVHFLVQQGKAEEALAVADQSRARTLAQGLGLISDQKSFKPAPIRAAAVAQNAGGTLLFYWLGEKQSYLWAVTSSKTAIYTLPPQREIKAAVERYRNALLGPNDPLEPANQDGIGLYRMLVAPAAKLIRPNTRVVVLTDGALSELNFETLIVPDPHPHYFIEDATLVSAPSLRMLAKQRATQPATDRLLLIGDPVSSDPDFPELPQAAGEMKQITRHFAGANATLITRKAANPGSYLASAPQNFSYIHFVAHGVASHTDPLDSAIILSRAGADGAYKLYARDIIQRPISARLVTISACSGSGSRSYSGEGLVGLSWAFLRAGAHRVIGALWEVSDDSTPLLMDSLYAGIEKGMTPAAALRQAKLTLLHEKKSFRAPFYWAPFQLYEGL